MTPQDFVSNLDAEKIVAAIAAAEKTSSGEIRVYISEKKVDDPLAVAREQFVRLAMTKTRERNGVLLFFAPESQTFAIVGDEGIHARCGENFWNSIASDITARLKDGALTEAIVHTVQKVGLLLVEHFPRRADDQNELPDQVERG